MIRATLDANVIVGAFPAVGGVLAAVRQAWRDEEFILITSEHILNEVAYAWDDPYWQRRFPAGSVGPAIELLRAEAIVAPLTSSVVGVASHPEDDLVLATAVSGDADYLVTGDKQLLALGAFQSVRIVSPRDFLGFLDRQKLGVDRP